MSPSKTEDRRPRAVRLGPSHPGLAAASIAIRRRGRLLSLGPALGRACFSTALTPIATRGLQSATARPARLASSLAHAGYVRSSPRRPSPLHDGQGSHSPPTQLATPLPGGTHVQGTSDRSPGGFAQEAHPLAGSGFPSATHPCQSQSAQPLWVCPSSTEATGAPMPANTTNTTNTPKTTMGQTHQSHSAHPLSNGANTAGAHRPHLMLSSS